MTYANDDPKSEDMRIGSLLEVRVPVDIDGVRILMPVDFIADAALNPPNPTSDELRIHLHNKLQLADAAKRRARLPFGQIYNRLAGEDPDHVELTGARLSQALQATGRKAPADIVLSQTYFAPLTLIEEAVEALS